MTERREWYRRSWLLPAAVSLVWVAALGFTGWLFSSSGQAFFGQEETRLVAFEAPPALPQSLEPDDRIRLIHFWDPECPCERANRIHLESLVREWAPRGLSLRVVPVPGASRPEDFRAGILQRAEWLSESSPLAVEVPASPSVAIYGRDGELRYFGPYSVGGLCSPDGDGLVEPVLRAMEQGQRPGPRRLSVLGCYCDW